MQAIDLISDEIFPLSKSDSGNTALQLMENFKLSELPLVDGAEFLGLVKESDLLDMSDLAESIGTQKLALERPIVFAYEHIYEVLGKMALHKLSLIPILDEKSQYVGVITMPKIIDSISNLAAIRDIGGILQLELNVNDYSLSEISSIVESNGAKILSLYIHTHNDSTKMDVTIKINKTDLSAIIQTFNRYNYTVVATFHKSEMEDQTKKRFNEFMHYLNM